MQQNVHCAMQVVLPILEPEKESDGGSQGECGRSP